MSEKEGSIKLYRAILDSQVFANQIALKIWIWCLCKATFKQRFVPLKCGKGEITVKLLPGQFIFGRYKAEDELNIDGSTIYKWMQKFSSPEFDMINIESNNQYSIITICKWNTYQTDYKAKVTAEQQPSDSRVTAEEQLRNTYNNVFNVLNVKNDNKEKFVLIFDTWLKYKSERKENYKQTGLETFLKQLLKFSDNSPEKATQIIERSMANNWKGIFELKDNLKKQNNEISLEKYN